MAVQPQPQLQPLAAAAAAAAAVVAPAAKTKSSSRSCSINTVAAVAGKVAGGDAIPGGSGEGLFDLLSPEPEMIPRCHGRHWPPSPDPESMVSCV